MLSGTSLLTLPLAFLGGFLASISPCALSNVGILLSYVGQGKRSKSSINGVVFSYLIGLLLSFVIIGVITATLGMLLSSYIRYVYIVLGIILIISALSMSGLFAKKDEPMMCSIEEPKVKKQGKVGAFFLGLLGGLIASPCATPTLIAVLSMVSVQASLPIGIFSLLLYGIGIALVPCLIALFYSKLSQKFESIQSSNVYKKVNLVVSLFIFGLGLYLFYLGV